MNLFGRRYYDAEPIRLRVESGKISQVTPGRPPEPGPFWPWIAPGLFDIQVNGYRGQEFSSPSLTAEKVAAIIHAYDAFGVTRSSRHCSARALKSSSIVSRRSRRPASPGRTLPGG